MALDTNIVGTNLDAGGNVKTALTNTAAYIGGVRMWSENDPGTVTGSPYLKSPETSNDYRLRVGIDSVWDTEVFNYTTQNQNKHKYTTSTMTATWATLALNLNGGSSVAASVGAIVQSYKYFPLLGSGVLYIENVLQLSAAPPTGQVSRWGWFTPGAATGDPTDGVYFNLSDGVLTGVINNNGVTTAVSLTFTFTPATNYKFTIAISQDEVEFWIDDVFYGELPRQTATGAITAAQSMPWAVQMRNTGAGASAVCQVKIGSYSVSQGDIDTVRLWATQMASQGQTGIIQPSGSGVGQTANYANSAAPASATLSNTSAGYTTLGGQFQFAAVAGAETDYALFAFQATSPQSQVSGKSLVIRGIWIDTMNTGAAVATTATWLQWSLGIGATAVTLATADGAATRAAKRIALGNQVFPIAAAIGAQATRLDVNLDAPLVVDASTYIHVIVKMPLGTATASQVIRGIVGINAYWE